MYGPDWLLSLLDQLSLQQREQILFLFWRAWLWRNDLVFGKVKESITSSANSMGNFKSSFTANHDTIQLDSSNKFKKKLGGVIANYVPVKENVVWISPPADYIKIDVDANFVESINAASVGVVARNSVREIIISSWDFIGQCSNVYEAELRACLARLYIDINLHQPIFFESDCAFIYSFHANEKRDRSTLVDLKKEALSIAKMFQNLSFSKVSWRANEVAHGIS
ncbi:hypothetical protein ZWY2020_042261 [Hordeum vulgare]|nr:hypothetical protein ZWY2020_042261 [Hordeum vulgare]